MRKAEEGKRMHRILVVEDDEAIFRLLLMNLSVTGYAVEGERDGLAARQRIERGERFDLALLDIMLPGADGFTLLETFQKAKIPVIFLTAKNAVEDKVKGLRDGAEDYIVKPFELMELLVRIEKVLSRHAKAPDAFEIGDLEVNLLARTVQKGGKPLDLTPTQFDLLALLYKNGNVALSRERILAAIWNSDFMGESRAIDNHISQLRRKTGLPIVAVSRVGYRLEVPV